MKSENSIHFFPVMLQPQNFLATIRTKLGYKTPSDVIEFTGAL